MLDAGMRRASFMAISLKSLYLPRFAPSGSRVTGLPYSTRCSGDRGAEPSLVRKCGRGRPPQRSREHGRPPTWRAVDSLPLLGQQRGAIECGAGQGHRARRRPSSAARAAGHRAPAAGLGHRVLGAADLDVGRR